ncbi:uncharacterized protein [Drosophila pseudoobscura]|uniref:CCHC-type domain-containing protein n=1 Tax=Drosophila pseudoobscura pseudoobscura TaxID=46245 RepID=A0A6I8W6D0_DROPS|nr:uncharacterized protein LOC117184612 [Drosophila pseudoobscura]
MAEETMANIDKEKIVEWLLEKEIIFPARATLRQLRKLAISGGMDEVSESLVNKSDIESEEKVSENEQIDDMKEEELLDAAIRVAEKKKKLAALMVMDNHVTDDIRMVKQLIAPFSASENDEASEWVLNFERICGGVNESSNFKLRCVRMLMKAGTEADLFMRVDKSKTYDEFKGNFLKTFGRSNSTADVVLLLKETFFNPEKNSVMGYILRMEEIAMRADIEEKLTVQFIIDGFRDRSSSIALLYSASTIGKLKELARQYEALRKSTQTNFRRTGMTASGNDRSQARCYNCSAHGHYASSCPAPKREKGSCFQCGSMQHQVKDCQQKPMSAQRSVGTASNPPMDDREENNIFVPIVNQRY